MGQLEIEHTGTGHGPVTDAAAAVFSKYNRVLFPLGSNLEEITLPTQKHARVHARAHTHTHQIYTHIHVQIYRYAQRQIDTHADIHIHVYTCMHT